jgi:hypothetical protein
LEQQNQELAEMVRRQQAQLQDGFRARDDEIRQLNAILVRQVEQRASGGADSHEGIETLQKVIADLNKRLGQETTRRQRLDQRTDALSAGLRAAKAALQVAERQRDALARDLSTVEDEFVCVIEPSSGEATSRAFTDQTILYVGGRAKQVPQFKAWVERTGARFLHHDGGIEHSPALLPGLASRADLLCFPIDCVSHDAVATIKRLCRQLDKPYRPLRTSSIAALMSALKSPTVPSAAAAE